MSESVTELSAEALLCRTLGHAWDPIPYDGERRGDYQLARSVRILEFRCTRCHTLRYEAWSKITGDFLFRDYVYEDHDSYKLPKDEGMRVNMRAEFLRRWDPKKTDAPTHLRLVQNNRGRGRRRTAS